MVDLISDLFHDKELKCQLLSNEKGRSFPREADARTVVANLGVLLLGGPGSSRRLIESGLDYQLIENFFFFSEVPFGLKSPLSRGIFCLDLGE